jgi:hypothetical protein
MTLPQKHSRADHKVELFTHIGNECLANDFFLHIELYKNSLMQMNGVTDKRVDRSTLDHLNFLDLISYFEIHFNIKYMGFPRIMDIPGRSNTLDEYLIATMVMNEFLALQEVYGESYFDEAISLTKLRCMDRIIGMLGIEKITHDSRNIFFATYTSSFIKNNFYKLSNALNTSINMSYDRDIAYEYPYPYLCEGALCELRTAIIINASYYINNSSNKVIPEEKIQKHINSFHHKGMTDYLRFDFLNRDVVEFSGVLSKAITWIDLDGIGELGKDLIIGEWLTQQCAIYYAYHMDSKKLHEFIDAAIMPLADYFEYSQKDLSSVKEMMFKQSLIIEPEHFILHGYSLNDFLSPYDDNNSKSKSKKFPLSQGTYTRSTDKNCFWLSAAPVNQIIKQANFNIDSKEIIDNFSNKDFQYEILMTLKPDDYIDYFISEMDTASNAHLNQVAKDLMGSSSEPNVINDIQTAYVIKMANRNVDKKLNAKKLGLEWVNRDDIISSLRNQNLLGLCSAISLLGLSSDDLKQDMGCLSTQSKRYLLSNDLEF